VAELLKKRLNTGRPSNLGFWRDRSGHEVDVVVEVGGGPIPVEVRSGATVSSDALRGLERWRAITGQAGPAYLVYGGTEAQTRGDVHVAPWGGLPSALTGPGA